MELIGLNFTTDRAAIQGNDNGLYKPGLEEVFCLIGGLQAEDMLLLCIVRRLSGERVMDAYRIVQAIVTETVLILVQI